MGDPGPSAGRAPPIHGHLSPRLIDARDHLSSTLIANCITVRRTNQNLQAVSKALQPAWVSGVGAAFVTAALASWSTPDGNLVVTSVPALAVGIAVFAVVPRRVHRDEQ